LLPTYSFVVIITLTAVILPSMPLRTISTVLLKFSLA